MKMSEVCGVVVCCWRIFIRLFSKNFCTVFQENLENLSYPPKVCLKNDRFFQNFEFSFSWFPPFHKRVHGNFKQNFCCSLPHFYAYPSYTIKDLLFALIFPIFKSTVQHLPKEKKIWWRNQKSINGDHHIATWNIKGAWFS